MARKIKISRYIGKIGWCNGHTFTSIERENGTFNYNKINQIKNGNIYPIPKKDLTLPRFSGIDKRVIKDISIDDIKYKGQNTIKGRHKHYINKYMK